jgi:hypothetical protein
MYTASTAPTLLSILDRPGPYTTVYLDTTTAPLVAKWEALAPSAAEQGAPVEAIDAITAAASSAVTQDIAGWGTIAASDGTVVVLSAPEATREEICMVSAVPHLAPMLEWGQRSIPHLAVVVSSDRVETVPFTSVTTDDITVSDPDPAAAARDIARLVNETESRLVAIADDGDLAGDLHRQLLMLSPLSTTIELVEADTSDAFADAVVRLALHEGASATVAALGEFRTHERRGATVDGVVETVQALRSGAVDLLLVHADPADERLIWCGLAPTDIGYEAVGVPSAQAVRLVDGLIWSALLQGAAVRIVPTTGNNGPSENVGAITRTEPTQRAYGFSAMVAA